MSPSTVRKRFHISGLTPAMTLTDIDKRLRGFCNILALDGFGTLDAVGQPRRFGYATLEATESDLKRCLNALSGTTWKGAKLRIGEAKPDYAQRLEAERNHAAEVEKERPPKRKRLSRGVQGVHSDDMSLVTEQNVEKHPGWHKTALSHLIRPMKMRPPRPLQAPTQSAVHRNAVTKLKKPRKSRGIFGLPTRARCRSIDPRLYGQIHLREDMLNAIVINTQPTKLLKPHTSLHPQKLDAGSNLSVPPADRGLPSVRDTLTKTEGFPITHDFNGEKQRDLGLLRAMFGDDESHWGSKESLGSEMEVDSPLAEEKNGNLNSEPDGTPETIARSQTGPGGTISTKPQKERLKDLFKPQEYEGFSLMAGLRDVDLDSDYNLDFAAPNFDPTPAPAPGPPVHTPIDSTATQPLRTSAITLNPTLPFFFPQPDNPRAKDLFTIARAEGWEFGRSGDTESIRRRWDAVKRPLTHEWKKRSREAVKARRRRYGTAEDEA